MWLGGSLARGDADAASDLDVIVTVADDSRQEFATAWRSWLQQISPTVLAEELPFAAGSFFSITPAFLRLDVVVESMSELPTTFFRQRVVVFDRDGLGDMLPAPHQGPGPSGDTVGALIREFFRISAVETILARDDWLLAREHLHVLSSLIYRLFVEANAPLPPMGVKQWSTKLTADQQRALLSLPTAAANRAELARSHQMAADVFLTNAGSLAARLGIPWPDDLERAARRHLQDHLGLEDPYPRTATIVV
jgi:predicted nucleotidyltransferase